MNLKGCWSQRKSLLVMLLSVILVSSSYAADYSPESLKWHQLKYSGSKFFISLDTSVSVDMISRKDAASELITTSEGEGKQPIADEIVKINVKNSVVGSDTDFTVWLEPDTTVLQRTSIYGGIKEWYRTYRFMSDKVYSDKRKPAKGSEEGKPWSTWTNIAQGFFQLDETEQRVTISESEALFYLIGVADLKKQGDKASLNMYDRSGVINASVTVTGSKRVSVDYKAIKNGQTSRIKKKVVALEAVVDARSIKENGNLEKFKFLGYKDDIRLLIDPELNTILEISGAVEYVGNVTIRLEEISLN
ncbi:hypothetical protein [Alkalimarinus sediminis]|uniref:DUF3108 domain-containing protein n=1 Tax=Alkalimarinus sediminis TaxID=1632866 RepID=A0A9E8HU98_9ALTE|nr:hypothetical protein [Alkalimarinus sediminis]UZW76646.1 hypothetical protein NNL22_08700 [Alkalimarinus sediminis]